jgi:uncharacterized protein DUF5989
MSTAISERKLGKKKSASWTERLISPVRTLHEFNQLAKRSGRGWWLIPMMATLVVLGVLLVFIQVIEYVAPFVYTIF